MSDYAGEMLQYLLTLKSERSTFSVSFEAADDDDAVSHPMMLVQKARVAGVVSAKVVRPDKSEIDVSDAVVPYLDRPAF